MFEFNSVQKLLRQPHICEMFAETPISDRYQPSQSSEFYRILDIDNSEKRTPYLEIEQFKQRGSLLSLHWPQRKLLLAELEFLTHFSDPKHLILYIGAASGDHILYLAKLFPDQAFILFDPNDFSFVETSQIKIYQEFFTDTHVKKFDKEEVLFISDIYHEKVRAKEDHYRLLQQWMVDQANWHRRLNTKKSFLKFRLPWHSGQTTYLNGDLYIPPFGARLMLETRLLVSEGEKVYDHTAYEEAIFHFHFFDKLQYYEHEFQDENLDACYHCRSEVEILKGYVLKHIDPTLVQKPEKLRTAIQTLSADISDFLSTFLDQKRTLRTNFTLPRYRNQR